MITVTKAKKVAGAGSTLRINIDHIIALQNQSPVDGEDFTVIILFGAQPFDAVETEQEIQELIAEARRKRLETFN